MSTTSLSTEVKTPLSGTKKWPKTLSTNPEKEALPFRSETSKTVSLTATKLAQ